MKMSKKKTETLATFRQRTDAAKGHRSREQYDDLWDRLVDLYKGEQFEDMELKDQIVINVAFATINVILPSVAINYPKLTVSAANLEGADSATILEAVLNYWWKHYDFQPEIQAAVKDFLVVGFGWLKCGWRFIEDEHLDEEAMEADFQDKREQQNIYAENNPTMIDQLPTQDDVALSVPEIMKTETIEDRPFVERVSPKDVYVDPEATSMNDAKWIAHKVTKTLTEVKENELYDPEARRSVRSDTQAEHRGEADGSKDWASAADDQDFKRVTVWEFYDITTSQMAVFPEVGDKFLIAPTDQPYEFGHPFVMLRNFDVPDHFYPMGDLEAIEPLQHELNMTRSAMFNDRKAFRRKWLYKRGAVDKKARQALESDKDNVFVPIDGSEELDRVVAHMPTAAPNQALYQDTDIIESDIVKITGLSDYQRGENSEVRRTATEASIIQDAANARAADKLAKVEKSIGEVGERLSILAQQYLDGEQTLRITGINGQPLWVDYDADDIEGDFDFEVEGGSTQPKNEQNRRRAAMDLMQGLGPLMDPQLGLINIPELVRHVLKDGFGISNPERFLSGGNDPVTAGMGDPNMGAADQLGPQAAMAQMQEAEGGGGAPAGQLPPELMAMLQAGGTPQEAPLPPPEQSEGGAAGIPPELAAMLASMDPSQIPPEMMALLQGAQGAGPAPAAGIAPGPPPPVPLGPGEDPLAQAPLPPELMALISQMDPSQLPPELVALLEGVPA